VALTPEGEQAFRRLRRAVVAFDRRLRTGLSDADTAALAAVLARLRANVAPDPIPTPAPPEAVP